MILIWSKKSTTPHHFEKDKGSGERELDKLKREMQN